MIVAGNFDHIEIWDAQRFREHDRAGTASIVEGEGIDDFACRCTVHFETYGARFAGPDSSPSAGAVVWPLLRPLSAVADPGRHPGRRLSTGGLEPGAGGRTMAPAAQVA